MAMSRLLLIEDNPLFMRGLCRFLEPQPSIEVVGKLQSPKYALSQIDRLKPDVVVTDLAMPEMSGLSLIEKIVEAYPQVGCVVLTMHNTSEYRDVAMDVGAHAFVSKSLLKTHLLPAIEEARRAIAEKYNPEA